MKIKKTYLYFLFLNTGLFWLFNAFLFLPSSYAQGVIVDSDLGGGNTKSEQIVKKLFIECKDSFEAQKFKRAIQSCEDVIIKDPTHIEGNILLATIYINKSRDLTKAKKHIKKILLLDPDNFNVPFLKGKIFINESKYNIAIDEFRAALKTAPDNGEIYYNIGNAYSNLGRLTDAIIEYETAVLLDRKNLDFKKALDAFYKEAQRSLQ